MNNQKLPEEDTRPSFLKKNEVSVEEIIYKNKKYPYTIVKKELAPELPGFIGVSNGEHLFISEQVPIRFRDPQLIHEIIEFTELKGKKGVCLEALKNEFLFVPEEIKEEYIKYRRNFFFDLIKYHQESKDEVFKSEIKGSYDFLCTL